MNRVIIFSTTSVIMNGCRIVVHDPIFGVVPSQDSSMNLSSHQR